MIIVLAEQNIPFQEQPLIEKRYIEQLSSVSATSNTNIQGNYRQKQAGPFTINQFDATSNIYGLSIRGNTNRFGCKLVIDCVLIGFSIQPGPGPFNSSFKYPLKGLAKFRQQLLGHNSQPFLTVRVPKVTWQTHTFVYALNCINCIN